MSKRIFQLFIALLLAFQGVTAQTVEMPDLVVAPGEVLMPVNMTGFSNVAAITLEVEYDANVMSFVAITNTTLAGSWTANYSSAMQKLVITFQATPYGTGYAINGKLLDIKFNYLGGFATPVEFGGGCEIATSNLAPIPGITYNDGSVSQISGSGTVSLGTEIAAPTTNVEVPVTMSGAGYSDVKGLTFKIGFDPAKLTFSQVTNSVLGGSLSATAASGILTITWTGTSKDLSALTNVFDVKFVYNGGGTAPVTFEPGCQVSNSSLTPISSNYTDGAVNEDLGSTTLTLGDISGDQGEIESVPLTLGLLDGGGYLGALSLNIAYDATKLSFDGITPGLITTGIAVTNLNGVLHINWSKSTNTTDLTGVLMSLRFLYNTSLSVPITFEPGCVLTRTNLSNIEVTYFDGSISSCSGVIGTEPTDATITYGDNASFTVVAPNPCYYKWQVNEGSGWTDLANDAVYSGVATGTLMVTLPGSVYADYLYRCEVAPASYTDEVAIIFNNPVITDQPDAVVVNCGDDAFFSILATGYESLQWQGYDGTNWVSLPLANSPTLDLYDVGVEGNGVLIRCLLQPNDITSDEVLLTVNSVVSTQPVNDTVAVDGEATFTVDGCADEYQWYVSDDGGSNWTLMTGETNPILTLTGVTGDMNGYLYKCQLSPGAVDSDPATLTVTFTVSGVLKYAEDDASSSNTIPFSTVYLKTSDGSSTLAFTVTDSEGNYSFSNVIAGAYKLEASSTIDATQAYDETDAFYIYIFQESLLGLRALAADVNMADGIDETDAFIVYLSYDEANYNKIPEWTAPDWIFESLSISVLSDNLVQDIQGICSGDVNADFNPNP